MITVTNNGVQQINAALLALDREIRNVNNGIAKIQKLVDGIDLGVVRDELIYKDKYRR